MLPYIFLEFQGRPQWRAHLETHLSRSEIFVPGNTHVSEGDTVNLDIHFRQENATVTIRGVVLDKLEKSTTQLRAGLIVRFGANEQRTLDLLRNMATGAAPEPLPRADRRFPIAVAIEHVPWEKLGSAPYVRSLTRDFSRSGAFLRTDTPNAIGSILGLRFTVPGTEEIVELRAMVVWASSNAPAGMGLRFLFDAGVTRRAIDEFVDRLGLLVAKARAAADVPDMGPS